MTRGPVAPAAAGSRPPSPSPYAAKPWLRLLAPAQRAPVEPRPTVLHAFRAAAHRAPGRTAPAYFDGRVTYAEADALSDSVAGHLAVHGVRRGDRVAVMLQNTPHCVLAVLAAWKAGAVVVPLNPRYKAGEVGHVLRDSGATALVCDGRAWSAYVREAAAGSAVRAVLTARERDFQTRDDPRVLPPDPDPAPAPTDATPATPATPVTPDPAEAAVRGPQVVPGYWGLPESAAAFPDGELRTGDVGFMDADGWLYVVDRMKDMISASGFTVWPREVEDVLHTHPAVREAAVVGVPDPNRGESVKAYVSLLPGTSVEPAELSAYCAARTAAYKYPRQVEILPVLPKTTSGKILRRELRDRG
ncbi:AMP-binding protein [Streptomyces subrutilus]|uniref:class I adenylate-forming enzyme family protein n=1 Tax=Streptomyces subrutilus TaxID=36818 RepID=UPI003435A772